MSLQTRPKYSKRRKEIGRLRESKEKKSVKIEQEKKENSGEKRKRISFLMKYCVRYLRNSKEKVIIHNQFAQF